MSISSIIQHIEEEVADTFGHLEEKEQKIVKAISLISMFDAKGAVTAIREKNIAGILGGADEMLSIIGLFFPPAATAQEWVKLAEKAAPAFEFIAKMYAEGLVRGIDYKDPAYNAPAGSENISTGA